MGNINKTKYNQRNWLFLFDFKKSKNLSFQTKYKPDISDVSKQKNMLCFGDIRGIFGSLH